MPYDSLKPTPSFPPPSPTFGEEKLAQAKAHALEALAFYNEAFPFLSSVEDYRLLDILSTYAETGHITPRQLSWLRSSLAPYIEAEPLQGDFKGIWVMFMLAGKHIQTPKVRLLSQEQEIYFELWFQTDYKGQRSILLFQGGWQGHGRRVRIGTIDQTSIRPWRSESIPPDILSTIQAFSLDPARIALASAKKLSACSFCGSRLSDEESKTRGYGPVCADHFSLPWGKRDEKTVKKIAKIRDAEDLSTLF